MTALAEPRPPAGSCTTASTPGGRVKAQRSELGEATVHSGIQVQLIPVEAIDLGEVASGLQAPVVESKWSCCDSTHRWITLGFPTLQLNVADSSVAFAESWRTTCLWISWPTGVTRPRR